MVLFMWNFGKNPLEKKEEEKDKPSEDERSGKILTEVSSAQSYPSEGKAADKSPNKCFSDKEKPSDTRILNSESTEKEVTVQVGTLFKPMEKNKETIYKVKLEVVAEEASEPTGVMNCSGDENISTGPEDDLQTLELQPDFRDQVP